MKMPRAPPPKLSSFNRTYKRSSSVGVGVGSAGRHDRTQSLERSRPIISQVVEASEKEEMAREKSFIEVGRFFDGFLSKLEVFQIHRRANSMRNSDSRRESAKMITSEIKEEPQASTSTAAEKPPVGRNPSPGSRIPAPASGVPTPTSIVKRQRSVSPGTQSKPRQPPEPQRTPKRGPPPVKRVIKVANPEEFTMERENTRTIITKEQHKELGVDPTELGMPQVNESPKIKPKSVVRPMPKNPSLAASTPAASIQAPQPSNKELTRNSSNSTKISSTVTTTPSQRPRPKSSALPTRQTAASAARAVPPMDRAKRVESKIPKVRA